MDRGLSFKIVWIMAAEEAIAAQFEFIEPPHIFNAVLKFAEMSNNDLGPHARDRHSKKFFVEEQDTARDLLEAHKIIVPEDSKKIRRALRKRLGKSDYRAEPGWSIHRSEASRKIARTAEKIASESGSRLLKAEHILKALFDAPSRSMGKVLEEAGVITGAIDEDTQI